MRYCMAAACTSSYRSRTPVACMIQKFSKYSKKKIIIIFSRSVCLSFVRPSVARQSLESSSLPPPPSVRFQSVVVGCGNTASATRLYCAFPRARACRAVRRVVLLPGACVRVRAVCCGARPVWRHSRTPQTRSIWPWFVPGWGRFFSPIVFVDLQGLRCRLCNHLSVIILNMVYFLLLIFSIFITFLCTHVSV